MIAPVVALDVRAVARRLVTLITDDEIAELRMTVLGLHADGETDETQRNAAVREELASTLDTAADALNRLT